MATLQSIKARVSVRRDLSEDESNTLHKQLVEDVLCSLDMVLSS